jgi:hypothetical protein
MILGHDFHSESGYRASFALGAESQTQPTWRSLLGFLAEVGLEPKDCFVTNAFMGLRAGDATSGLFPGASAPEFVAPCRRFLVRQLQVQQPSLILTLGIHVPRILAPLSPELASWAVGRGLKHLDTGVESDHEEEPLFIGVRLYRCRRPVRGLWLNWLHV